jgi:GT2 family glycosyltransferase
LSDIGISVIIRTKDRPDLLRQALESVAQQAFEPLEAVVVNDGGADVSAVLEGFSGRLDIRHQRLDPPLGRSPAANRGLALASHPWITFLDDDDLLEPGALAALAEHTGEPAVIYGRVTAWQMVPDDGEPRAFTEFGRPFDRAALLFENFIPMIGTLMPRDAVLAAGGIDEALDCYEDWDLYLRLSETLPCRFVDRDVAAYRVFGEAFITGAGGQEKQHRGRETIYRKHWSALDPETLSRMQYHAKGHLIPEAVARESEAWKDRLADLEHGLDDARKGAAFYQEQVEERDGRLKTLWQEREAIAAERDDALRQRHALGQRCDGLTRELQSETSRTTPVSVVIVNYNGRHHLEECLPSVAQTANVPIEVIVADNGSTDDSLEWVREHHPDVRILELGANLGFGEANRRGIEASTSEYVALLNNDTVVERGWLHEMLRVLMADPTVGAACSTLHFMQHPGVLNGRGGGMSKLGYGFDHDAACPAETGEEIPAVRDVLFPTAAAMLMRKRDFGECGGFDQSYFMYHEDVDLGWRLWLLGWRVVVVRDSIVHHHFGGTTGKVQSLAWRERLGSRHNVRTILKHYEWLNVARAFKGLLNFWLGIGAYRHTLHVAWWNLRHLPGTLRQRRFIQSRRHWPDAHLFEHGLISRGPFPAPLTELPRPSTSDRPYELVETPILRVGRHSALGRLGPGWYPPEPIEDDAARAFCGDAQCCLQVAPGATGALEVDVHVPHGFTGLGSISVWANGATASAEPSDTLWQTLRVNGVTADGDGHVAIRLHAPSWRPHQSVGNWDFRRLAGAVRRVEFVSDHPSTPPAPGGLSVLITTYNRWDILHRTLESLRAQATPRVQVIVVDDGSVDGTYDRLVAYRDRHGEAFRLTIQRQENQGQGMARNNGLALVEEELVLFLGDDIIPAPGFVEAHLRRHITVSEPAAVVGFTDWDRGAMTVTPFMEMVNVDGHQFGYGFMKSGADQPYSCFYTSNISVPRAILGERPFDPRFSSYGWEDVELGYRLSLRGVRIVYDEAARAGHHHPTTVTTFYRRQEQVGATVHKVTELHPELARDPHMPPPEAPSWYRRIRLFAPLVARIASAVDRRGIALPKKLLHHLMMIGFYAGRDRH